MNPKVRKNIIKTILLLVCVATIFAIDQYTKKLVVTRMSLHESIEVIGDAVRFTFVYNYNGAFGLNPGAVLPFIGSKLFYTIFSVLAVLMILYLYYFDRNNGKLGMACFILILGGGLGNMYDRFMHGKVVDFIDVNLPDIIMERFFIFNFADSCVTVGVFTLVIVSFFQKRGSRCDKVDCSA